jgi:AbiU2
VRAEAAPKASPMKQTGNAMEPQDQLNELLHAVEAAESCFAIWEFLILRDKGLEQHLLRRVLEDYRQFFLPTKHAHFVEIVMSLSRLYDETAGAVSLLRCRSLRVKLKQADRIQFKKNLAISKPTAKKIRALRDNLFAHRLDVDSAKLFREVRLKIDDVIKLVATSRQLVDLLRTVWNFPKRDTLNPSADTIRVLQRLGA